MLIQRGEVYFVELGPTRGREIDAKRRPADEEFVRFVPQEDARPLRSEQPRGRLRHFGQQRHHLLCLLPTGGDFQNGL